MMNNADIVSSLPFLQVLIYRSAMMVSNQSNVRQ